MAHKVHPKVYRLYDIQDWDSRWFDLKNFSKNLEEDFKIREYLKRKFEKGVIEKVEIERVANQINVIINTPRPGLIIGRGGAGVEELKKELETKVLKLKKDENSKKDLRIEIREVKKVWASASLVAQYMAQQIERRVPYRRVLKQALDKIMSSPEIKGARVMVAGRLNGIEIARTEWLQKGRLPRNTIRAVIDYAFDEAHCTYGTIGVKVWIYKGEREI